MKIACIPVDHEGIGSYRILYPLEALAKRGLVEWEEFPVRLDETINDQRSIIYDLTEPPEADLYLLQRPLEKDVLDWMPELQKRAPVIVELDDDYMSLPPGNQAFAGTSPKWQDRARAWAETQGKTKLTRQDILQFAAMAQMSNRNILHQIIHQADAVTVSTPALQRRYDRPYIHVCPNVLRWVDWAEQLPFMGRFFTVGCTADHRWKKDDIQLLQGLIGPWIARHPDSRFFAAGDPKLLGVLGIPERQGTAVPRALFPAHAKFIGNMHVGLVPLQQTAFNQAKSALTGMELNASYVPVIASATDSYAAYQEQGGDVNLAEKPRDWIRYLDVAYNAWAGGAWPVAQQNARQVAKRFTIDEPANSDVWFKVYKEVCNRRSKESLRTT